MKSRLSGEKLIELKNAVVAEFDASNGRELGALTNCNGQIKFGKGYMMF